MTKNRTQNINKQEKKLLDLFPNHLGCLASSPVRSKVMKTERLLSEWANEVEKLARRKAIETDGVIIKLK
jgi:hypothetical protein